MSVTERWVAKRECVRHDSDVKSGSFSCRQVRGGRGSLDLDMARGV